MTTVNARLIRNPKSSNRLSINLGLDNPQGAEGTAKGRLREIRIVLVIGKLALVLCEEVKHRRRAAFAADATDVVFGYVNADPSLVDHLVEGLEYRVQLRGHLQYETRRTGARYPQREVPHAESRRGYRPERRTRSWVGNRGCGRSERVDQRSSSQHED